MQNEWQRNVLALSDFDKAKKKLSRETIAAQDSQEIEFERCRAAVFMIRELSEVDQNPGTSIAKLGAHW